MRWAGHVARMGERRVVDWDLVGKPEGKSPLGRPRRRWEDNINPLHAELNPICHLLTLLGAHHILHVSRVRINLAFNPLNAKLNRISNLLALLGAHPFLHVSRVRVKWLIRLWCWHLFPSWILMHFVCGCVFVFLISHLGSDGSPIPSVHFTPDGFIWTSALAIFSKWVHLPAHSCWFDLECGKRATFDTSLLRAVNAHSTLIGKLETVTKCFTVQLTHSIM